MIHSFYIKMNLFFVARSKWCKFFWIEKLGLIRYGVLENIGKDASQWRQRHVWCWSWKQNIIGDNPI